MPPTTRSSRRKHSSVRLLNDPAEAAMSTACSVENACAGFVSIAPATNSPIVEHASSSADRSRSQWWKEIVSSSRARGCAHGSRAPTSAASSSSSAVRRCTSAAVFSCTGRVLPR